MTAVTRGYLANALVVSAALAALLIAVAPAGAQQPAGKGKNAAVLQKAFAQRQSSAAGAGAMSYSPLLRPGQSTGGELTDDDSKLSNGLIIDLYTYEGTRNEFLNLGVNAGFDAVVVIGALDKDGNFDEYGESQAGASSTLELKLPTTQTYAVIVTTDKPGTTGAYTLSAASKGIVANFDWARLYPGGGDPGERYALLIGVSDYPGEEHDLGGGPLNDVDLMHSILVDKYGFKDQNILILRDQEGNRDQIIEAFRRHLGQAGPNGVAVFFYSGHGMQLPDNRYLTGADDPEPDGKDEALAVWGTQGGKYGYILDDEMGILLGELKAGRVLVMLDDCFSGTATRGSVKERGWSKMGGKAEVPPGLIAARGNPTNSKFTPWKDIADKVQTPLSYVKAMRAGVTSTEYANPSNHILLAASADNETSMNFPIKLDDGRHISVGLFTFVFYLTSKDAPADITFADLMAKVSATTRETAINSRGDPQTPEVEGQRKGESMASYLAKK